MQVLGLELVVGYSMWLIKVGSPSSQRRRYIGLRVAEDWKCAAAPTT